MADSSARFFRFLSKWSPEQVQPSLTTTDPKSIHPTDEQNVRPRSLRGLSSESIAVLKRFIDHPIKHDLLPKKRRAAVMVGLFASRHGHLNVLLTRRSRTMRTYAGQTALPGGKMEPRDASLEETARREAFEECGISRDRRKVHKLTTLPPFLSRGNLIVTPIVFFIADQKLMPRINAQEVDILFSHPLEKFLTVIGYGREPDFAWKADGQLPMSEVLRLALNEAIEFQTDQSANRVGKHNVLEDGPQSLLERVYQTLQDRFTLNKAQTLSSIRNLLRPKL